MPKKATNRSLQDPIETAVRKESRGNLKKKDIEKLVKTDPAQIQFVLDSLASFAQRDQIIMDLSRNYGITVAQSRVMVDLSIEMVSVMSTTFHQDLLTSIMLQYQRILGQIDKEMAAATNDHAKVRWMSHKIKAVENLQDLIPSTQIIKADINQTIEGPSIGERLIELYGLNTSETIDVGPVTEASGSS